MFDIFYLSKDDKRKFYFIVFSSVFVALFEAIGVAFLYPLFSITIGNPIETSSLYYRIYALAVPSGLLSIFSFYLGMAVFALVGGAIFRGIISHSIFAFTHGLEATISQTLLKKIISSDVLNSELFSRDYITKTVLSESEKLIVNHLAPMLKSVALVCTVISMAVLIIVITNFVGVLFVAAVIAFYIILSRFFVKRSLHYGEYRSKANTERFEAVTEIANDYKSVIFSNADDLFLEKFTKASNNTAKYNTYANSLANTPRYVLEALIVSVMLSFTILKNYYDIYIVPIDSLSVVAFALLRAIPNVQQLFGQFVLVKYSLTIVKDLRKIYELKPRTLRHKTHNPSRPYALKFDSVSFEFQNGHKIINDFSFEIPRTGLVLIAGPSGSGKSTLLSLMSGILAPTLGTITASSDIIIAETGIDCGYVPQKGFAISGSIYRNIALQEVVSTTEANIIDGLLDKCNLGVDTIGKLKSGELRVTSLSGGQLQRVALARAIYHKKRIVFMDEPTNGLDQLNRAHTVNVITQMSRDALVVVITHTIDDFPYACKIINCTA